MITSQTPGSPGSRTPYQRLWQILYAERKDIKLVVIYGMAVGIFSLVVPIAAQSLVNTVVFNFLLQPILVLALIVTGILSVASVLKVIQTAMVETIQTRIFARISLDLAYRLPRVRVEAYDRHRGTELVNRFFEVVTVQKAFAFMLVDGLSIILQALIGMVLLAFYHPLLLAFDVVLMACIVLVIVVPARRGVTTSIKESKAKYHVASWLEEMARIPLVFKLSGGHQYALKRADEATLSYLKSRREHFRTLILQISGTLLVQTVLNGLFLGLGSFLVMRKQLTLGQLVAAEIIVTMVLSGFAKFGKYLETFYDLVASVDKLSHLFDLPLEHVSREKMTIGPAGFHLKLKGVSFAYSDKGPDVLRLADLEASSGERLGIAGGNGAGKSTLFDLILGIRRPQSGMVEVQGYDLRDVSVEDLRSQVALVRSVEIIDGTILDNIRVGREDVSLEDVRDALSKVQLMDEVSDLPDGLATDLSGSFSPLSAGQKQKLMIARAIVGKPKLLLLDEALEDLDSGSKSRLLQMLFDPKASWTLILATHDPQELATCTRTVKITDGKFEECAAFLGGRSS